MKKREIIATVLLVASAITASIGSFAEQLTRKLNIPLFVITIVCAGASYFIAPKVSDK